MQNKGMAPKKEKCVMSRKQKMPLRELLNRFGTEENCRDYLVAQRWPDGFVCPK